MRSGDINVVFQCPQYLVLSYTDLILDPVTNFLVVKVGDITFEGPDPIEGIDNVVEPKLHVPHLERQY